MRDVFWENCPFKTLITRVTLAKLSLSCLILYLIIFCEVIQSIAFV